MVGPPLDADAVEGSRLHTPSTNASQGSGSSHHQASIADLPSPKTAAELRHSSQHSLDCSEGLASEGRTPSHLDHIHDLDHSYNTPITSPALIHSLRYPSLHLANSTMSTFLGRPSLDGHEDSDCDDMVSSQSSLSDSPHFNSSLPFLVGRHVAQEQRDPEEASLSGDTVSNADTVSDRFDPAEDDSLPDYDQVTHDEIPAYLREAQEQGENLVMSDITVGPHTDASMNPLMQARSLSTSQVQIDGNESASVVVCPTADEPYTMPARPLRFLFVAEHDMDEQHQLLIVIKLVTAMTGSHPHLAHVTPIGKVYSSAPGYQIAVKDQVIDVSIEQVSTYAGLCAAWRKDGSIFKPLVGPVPDFAIFFRGSPDRGVSTGRFYADLIARFSIPVLEVSQCPTDLPCVQLVNLDRSRRWPGDPPFLHVAQMLDTDDYTGGSTFTALPVTLDVLLDHDPLELSRHLAFITKQHVGKPVSLEHVAEKRDETLENNEHNNSKHEIKKQDEPEDVPMTTTSTSLSTKGINRIAPLTAFKVLSLWLAVFLACRQYLFASTKLDPLSELTLRQEALSLALNKSAIATVDASSILHYPTTTAIVSGSTTIGVAFPTAVDVHVAKSNQLFVSLPKHYPSIDQVDLVRNDNKTLDYNSSKLIDGVYVLDLKPVDAYGHVYLKCRSTKYQSVNETVKVWLGSRLAHRATYEKVARHVQKDLQRDVEDAQNAARAVQAKVLNGTHSALKGSAIRARAIRDKLVDTASVAARQLSLGYQGASNTTARLTKTGGDLIAIAIEKDMQAIRFASAYARNATSAISSMLTSQIPAKQDFARARNNSLKLKGRLLRKPVLPSPKEVVPWSYRDQLEKVSQLPHQLREKCTFAFDQVVNRLQGQAQQKFKSELEQGRKRHAKEWKGELITVDQAAPEGNR